MALGVQAVGHCAGEARAWVRLTRSCNQRCSFCLDRGNQDGAPVPLGEISDALAGGAARGARRAVLSGGEPTLHPRFLSAVSAARALGYAHVQTVTNGRRFCNPAFARAAKESGLDEATFSVHGPDARTHEALTRAPGSFLQAVTGLRNARAAGLIVNADVVLTRLNLPLLRETLEFLGGLGVREFDLLGLVPFGDAWENWEELRCDPKNRAALHRALALSRRPGWRIWTNRLHEAWLDGYERLLQDPAKMAEEAAGRERELGVLLKEGREPACSGERCRHCWLARLCDDARSLARGESLTGVPPPACAGGGEALVLRPGASWGELSRFHALERRAGFTPRCRACALRPACDGLPLKAWREHG